MFIFVISYLTTSNLPWFMDLTFQVHMQYYPWQHWILLSSPDTSTDRHHFCFGLTSSFFLQLRLQFSPVVYWTPSDFRGSSFSFISFCLFILFMGFSGFPSSSADEESNWNVTDPSSSLGLGRSHWKRARLPTPVFLGFLGSSVGKESAYNEGDLDPVPGLGRSPGEGNGYLLQYSGLENSVDCIVHGVTKSQTWLRDFHFYFHGVLKGRVLKWFAKFRLKLKKVEKTTRSFRYDLNQVPYDYTVEVTKIQGKGQRFW